VPVHTVVALLDPVAPAVKSMADAVVHLGWLDWEGPPVRLAVVEKLGASHTLSPRQLFTLDGGEFRAPPPLPAGFAPPTAPLDPDPEPTAPTLWPGSSAFAAAFGRLPYHGITGLVLGDTVPNALAEAFWLPVVAHAVATGGRAFVIPPVSTTAGDLWERLTVVAPPAALRSRVRILSPVARVGGGAVPAEVRMPLPGRPSGSPPRRAPSESQLPLATRFLEGVAPGRPALYLVALDGLRAVAAAGRLDLDPSRLPGTMAAIVRLPRLHAFGVGREGDPLIAAFAPSLRRHLRLELREGHLTVFEPGAHGAAYLVDWPGTDGRYRLCRAA
jgi:hypothetical protein